MHVSKVGLQILIEAALKNELAVKDTKRLLMALWKKFWNPGLDSYKEKVVLSAFTRYPEDPVQRHLFMQELIERVRRNQNLSR